MIIPGYQPVTEPSLLIPRMGLVRSATEITDTPNDGAQEAAADGVGATQPRWVGGFGYVPQSCEAAQAIPMFCDPGDFDEADYTKVAGDNPDLVTYTPFVVVGRDGCATLDQERDRTARARQQLLATESYQIAQELWRGDLAREGGWNNRYLTDIDGDDLGTAGAAQALAELEYNLARCLHGQRGMIHATTYTATIWRSLGLIREDQGLLLTALDTIVVADAGYDGTGPAAGAAPAANADVPASANAYGTGIVYLRRGTITEVGDLASQVDRSINNWTVFVERPVAAVWDGCCLLSILVDHTESGISGAGGVDGGGA